MSHSQLSIPNSQVPRSRATAAAAIPRRTATARAGGIGVVVIWLFGFGLWGFGFGFLNVRVGPWESGVRPASAQDMPDPSLIHGRAIPAPELPAGTVTVRVVREAIGNDIAGQQVRVTVGSTTRTEVTDELGRAEFTGLPPGADLRAEATVDGESLVSQPFAVPSSGGLRIILVSGLAQAAERRAGEQAAEAAAPAVPGVVVLGNGSRVLMQFEEEALQVYYILEIVNNARTRVDIGGPLVIDLPRGAGGAAILPGSTPNASASGDRVTITGPFAAGTTLVQVGYVLRLHQREFTFEQRWPAALQQVTVGVQRVGDIRLTSSQFATTNEVRTDGGEVFVLGTGPGLQAGSTLAVTLSNLPVHSRTPRYAALALALAVVGVGVWLSVSSRGRSTPPRDALMARRESLLSDLARLEVRRRAGEVSSDRYTARRQRLLAELEDVYGELDESYAGPQGGGSDVAA